MATITKEDIEQYINEMKWICTDTVYDKMLLKKNLKRFYIWLTIKNSSSNITTVSGTLKADIYVNGKAAIHVNGVDDYIEIPDKTVEAPDYDMVLGG